MDEQAGHFDLEHMLCAACSCAPNAVALCTRCDALLRSGKNKGRMPMHLIGIAASPSACWHCYPRGADAKIDTFALCRRHRDLAASRGARASRTQQSGGGDYAPVAAHLLPQNHATRKNWFP
jgi:hypothetical protein